MAVTLMACLAASCLYLVGTMETTQDWERGESRDAAAHALQGYAVRHHLASSGDFLSFRRSVKVKLVERMPDRVTIYLGQAPSLAPKAYVRLAPDGSLSQVWLSDTSGPEIDAR